MALDTGNDVRVDSREARTIHILHRRRTSDGFDKNQKSGQDLITDVSFVSTIMTRGRASNTDVAAKNSVYTDVRIAANPMSRGSPLTGTWSSILVLAVAVAMARSLSHTRQPTSRRLRHESGLKALRARGRSPLLPGNGYLSVRSVAGHSRPQKTRSRQQLDSYNHNRLIEV